MSVNGVSVLGPAGAGRVSQPEDTRFQFRPIQKPSNVVRVGVIGYGYWGPEHRQESSGSRQLRARRGVRQESRPRCAARSKTYPGVQLTTDFSEVLTSPDIDAVADRDAGLDALRAGEGRADERQARVRREAVHVDVAAGRGAHRARVPEEPEDHGRPHVPVQRRRAEDSRTGRRRARSATLYYFDSTRVNLGLFQHDVSVIWDLAPHDLSIMDHIIAERPEAVVATGGSHLNGHADMAFITVYFPRNIVAHINVNWLSPVKVRTTLIGGKDKMLVWNDLEADEKIKIYDKGVEITSGQGVYDLLVSYRIGRRVGAEGGADRSAEGRARLLPRLHHERPDAVQRR